MSMANNDAKKKNIIAINLIDFHFAIRVVMVVLQESYVASFRSSN